MTAQSLRSNAESTGTMTDLRNLCHKTNVGRHATTHAPARVTARAMPLVENLAHLNKKRMAEYMATVPAAEDSAHRSLKPWRKKKN